MTSPWVVSAVKHALHILLYTVILVYVLHVAQQAAATQTDPMMYGAITGVCLIFLRCISFLVLPQMILNFIGLFLLNAFRTNVQLAHSLMTAPKIRIRTVTRGTFPELVFRTVQRNLYLVETMGLQNYAYEVVTDNAVDLPPSDRLKMILVPTEYRSKTGALFKSRALQYCLEPEVSCFHCFFLSHHQLR